jgi:hypothetical protein
MERIKRAERGGSFVGLWVIGLKLDFISTA